MNGSPKFFSLFSDLKQNIHVLTAEQMKAAEELHFLHGCSPMAMMENAVQSLANYIKRKYPLPLHKRVVALVGNGGNGADGAGIARVLQQYGYQAHIYHASGPTSEACLNQISYAKFMGVSILPENADVQRLVELCLESDLVIDALLGFGLTSDLRPPLASLIKALNAAFAESKRPHSRIIAVDLPSGLPAHGETQAFDDKAQLQHDNTAVCAHETLCLGHLKPCLVDDSYSRFYGKVTVVDIQLAKIDTQFTAAELIDSERAILDLKAVLQRSNRSLNKYSRGRCIVFAGSRKYPGAGQLSTAGALAAGTGYVNIVAQRIDASEEVRSHSSSQLQSYFPSPVPLSPDCFHENPDRSGFNIEQSTSAAPTCCLFGPGLSEFTRSDLDFMREWKGPLVLDAGALQPKVCSEIFPLPATMPLNSPRIITPHRGEFDRIWEHFGDKDQKSLREPSLIHKTKSISQKWNCTVVLKGATTIVSFPTGKTKVLLGANNSLARAGTGDVLAGFLAGLLSRDVLEEVAVCAALCIHNEAASGLQHKTSKYGNFELGLPEPCFPSQLTKAMTQIMNFIELDI